tara:strand:- start:90 stop:251 length:162 start_codon:yes stop_codon:yes gene_type:complete
LKIITLNETREPEMEGIGESVSFTHVEGYIKQVIDKTNLDYLVGKNIEFIPVI